MTADALVAPIFRALKLILSTAASATTFPQQSPFKTMQGCLDLLRLFLNHLSCLNHFSTTRAIQLPTPSAPARRSRLPNQHLHVGARKVGALGGVAAAALSATKSNQFKRWTPRILFHFLNTN